MTNHECHQVRDKIQEPCLQEIATHHTGILFETTKLLELPGKE